MNESFMSNELYGKFMFRIMDDYLESFLDRFIESFNGIPQEERMQAEDHGDETHWDRYSYYVQYNMGFYVSMYEGTVGPIINTMVSKLSNLEVTIIKQHFESFREIDDDDEEEYNRASIFKAEFHRQSLAPLLAEFIEYSANNHELPDGMY